MKTYVNICIHLFISDIRQVWPLESWKESWLVLEADIYRHKF